MKPSRRPRGRRDDGVTLRRVMRRLVVAGLIDHAANKLRRQQTAMMSKPMLAGLPARLRMWTFTDAPLPS